MHWSMLAHLLGAHSGSAPGTGPGATLWFLENIAIPHCAIQLTRLLNVRTVLLPSSLQNKDMIIHDLQWDDIDDLEVL